ncbi:ketopantoate reductase PanE/ApbA C terminal-domain-containing protein [Chytridium lagenaria]|nr:ketopantoate reductase PanE/ApbA C terminal-domain-containing protein [Chytridium lagenaria]
MFQNGAGAASMLREALGDFERTLDVVDGMWYFNVVEHEEGDVQQGSFGPLCVPDTEKGRWFKETLLNAGTECRVEKDMDSMVYGKLIMNLNNAINALSGLPLKREFLDYQYRHALALTQREAFKVLKAHQIEPISSTAVPAHLIPDFLLLPDTVFKGVMGKVFAVNDKGTSSMYEDLKAHRRTEIDFFQGEISRLGKIHGILTPLCDRAVELVKGLEERRAGIVRHSGEEMFGEGF